MSHNHSTLKAKVALPRATALTAGARTRTTIQINRPPYNKGPNWRAKHGDTYRTGFTIAFACHHCHGQAHFSVTPSCGDCVSADGATKRKPGLPPGFSFDPDEIAPFLRRQLRRDNDRPWRGAPPLCRGRCERDSYRQKGC